MAKDIFVGCVNFVMFNKFSIRKSAVSLNSVDLQKIKAAKVQIDTLDVDLNYGGPCRIVFDSGMSLMVPSKKRRDSWESHLLDVPTDKLSLIKMASEVRIVRVLDQDRFKIRCLMLAVQLSDNSWVFSKPNPGVQTNHSDYAFMEGDLFETPMRSRPVILEFPGKR